MKRMPVVIVLSLTMFFTSGAFSQTEKTILTFAGKNGSGPYTGLIQDFKGNFYGAAWNGGTYGNGVVYKLARNSKGEWEQTTLYSFSGGTGNGDGAYPQMPWLAIDKDGHLYGTTPNGGAHGRGVVFELSPASPLWKETILHSFTGDADGGQPIGGVTLNSEGNLYGTANAGGDLTACGGNGCGVVFELSPGTKGSWTYRVLHAFQGIPEKYQCNIVYDGETPYRTTLVLNSAGDVFGTTSQGGVGCGDYGTEWRLSPDGGNWTYTQLHVPKGGDVGQYPDAGMVLDSEGNLYFAVGGGSVLELVKSRGYAEKVLYKYPGPGADDVYGTVSLDKAGNLYWTSSGYDASYYGGVYELSPNGDGGWDHRVLYTFSDDQEQGTAPWAGVTIDATGNLYGTCTTGGGTKYPYKNGTVWEVTP